MIIKRPEPTPLTDEKNFIKGATKNTTRDEPPEDLHRYVVPAVWPFTETPKPSIVHSSNLDKPLQLRIKEFEWDSIDRHVNAMGVRKVMWVRHAIFKLMEEEQYFFLRQAREKSKY